MIFGLGAQTALASPNILLVIADDMGLDASPCHSVGSTSANMPTLKGLCENGMVFDRAYTPPVSSPTRAAILTGKYSFRTGIGGAINLKRNPVTLSPDEVSLFDQFQTQLPDYNTALIGKWHLSSGKTDFTHPAKLGVKNYFGNFHGFIKNYYHWPVVENGKQHKIDGYSTTVLTDRAVKWVSKQKKPWFLWLAYSSPHLPFHVPPSNLHSYSGIRYGDKPKGPARKRYYFAALQALDTELGRLLNSLKPETRKNTVVIFMSDNGTPAKVADNVYKRGTKKTLFEGGINVPMVFSGPGIKIGRSQALVNTTDLYSTILAQAGAKAETPDSLDFSEALKGGKGKRDLVFVEHFSNNKNLKGAVFGWAIRDARYKLLHKADGKELLFDLENDPFERINLLLGDPNPDVENIRIRLQKAQEEIMNSP